MSQGSPHSLTDGASTSPSLTENDLATSSSTSTSTSTPTRITIPQQLQQLQQPSNLTLKPSESTNTQMFRTNYDALLREVLEDNDSNNDITNSNTDHSMTTNNNIYDNLEQLHQIQQLDSIDIDMDAATADLPDELRAALEDRSLADKYLANLKTFMSHQRSHL
ncbi:unnamed protein product [Absidia cylindrospora]